jgi:hypothetical protein
MAKKSITPAENLEMCKKLMTIVPGIEVKGASMPYASLNGNMSAFLKEGSVALRLSAANREGFIKKYHASLFETFCTVMKEYVTISPALF